MEKATVIFKSDNEEKSLILNLSHNEENGDVDVQLHSEPRQKLHELLDTNEFYVRLAAILLDELGEIEQIK